MLADARDKVCMLHYVCLGSKEYELCQQIDTSLFPTPKHNSPLLADATCQETKLIDNSNLSPTSLWQTLHMGLQKLHSCMKLLLAHQLPHTLQHPVIPPKQSRLPSLIQHLVNLPKTWQPQLQLAYAQMKLGKRGMQ